MAPENPFHQIPPLIGFGEVRRRKPNIYTDDQISQLLQAAQLLKPQGTLRPKTYATLFGLVAVTGLRISEALALQLSDVTEVGLTIRETKFRKSRLVPIHPTTQQALDDYLRKRKKVVGATSHVFVSPHGKPLAYSTVISIFLALVRGMGVHPGAGLPGPRIHDLRHTFAVRSLEQCPARNRDQIHRHMHALSTYLGHTHLIDTYWYLHATPKLLLEIAETSENLALGKGVVS